MKKIEIVRKFVLLMVCGCIVFALSGCEACSDWLTMGEGQIPYELEKRYPGAFGKYQYVGYTFIVSEEDSPNILLDGSGVEPEDIFGVEFFSDTERQEICDYFVDALEFTGREIEFTTKMIRLKKWRDSNSAGLIQNKDILTETGFEFACFFGSEFFGVKRKVKFEYNSAKKESFIYIYFTLEDLDVDITLLFNHNF